jgi:hypothetical protein
MMFYYADNQCLQSTVWKCCCILAASSQPHYRKLNNITAASVRLA